MPRHLPRTLALAALFAIAPASAAGAQETPTTTVGGQPAATRTAIIAAVIARHDPALADGYLRTAAGEGTDPEQAAAVTLATFTRTNAPGAAKITLDLYRTDPTIARTVTLTILTEPAVGAAIFDPMYGLTTAAEVDGFLHVLEPTIDAAWELMVRFGPNTQDAIARAKARQLLDSPPTSGPLVPVEQYATGTTTPPATTVPPPTTVPATTSTAWAMFTPVQTTRPAATTVPQVAVGSTGRAGTDTRTPGEGGTQFPRWFLAFVLAAGILGYWWLQDRQEQDGKDATGKAGGAAPRPKRARWEHGVSGSIKAGSWHARRARKRAAHLFAPYAVRRDIDRLTGGPESDDLPVLAADAAQVTAAAAKEFRRWWRREVSAGPESGEHLGILDWPSDPISFTVLPDRRRITVEAKGSPRPAEVARKLDMLGIPVRLSGCYVYQNEGSPRLWTVELIDAEAVDVTRTWTRVESWVETENGEPVTVSRPVRHEVVIGRRWRSLFTGAEWFEPAAPEDMCTPGERSPTGLATRNLGVRGSDSCVASPATTESGAHNTPPVVRLSVAAHTVLAALVAGVNATDEIAARCGKSRQNTDAILARLADRGLVAKVGPALWQTVGTLDAATGSRPAVVDLPPAAANALHVEPSAPPDAPLPPPTRPSFVDRRVPYRPVPGSPLDTNPTGDTPWS